MVGKQWDINEDFLSSQFFLLSIWFIFL
uniref:Uncharacterized protein n=1 Tax=Rhizophora mucronata TaxID=61149 RepID=A0A2P2NF00_RHIMU